MCGIAGIVTENPSLDVSGIILKMTEAEKHRGPDGSGCFSYENRIGLGHRRLSIIDVSAESDQPFYSNCGNYVLIFNGEIYNYLSIKKKLPDYNFKTSSDSEVLLAAFITWGEECLSHLNGMFSFAIYNIRENTLFTARDRMGIKPFYYFKSDKLFLFASEIKSLLASGLIPKEIDKKGLVQYFKNKTVYTPNTIVQDVKMLEAGSYMFIKNGNLEIKKYWNILEKYNPEIAEKNYSNTKKDISNLLESAVERRLVSDVPLGAFLSGGIDSSIIVALASKFTQINTVAITFDEDKYDESKFSRIIAKKFNTHHHEINFKAIQLLEMLPDIMKNMDHPSVDGINTYFVSKKAKEAGLTVSLSGLGGDELFAGYYYFKWGYKYLKYLEKFPQLPFGQKLSKAVLALKENIPTHKLHEYFSQKKGLDSKYHILRQLYFSTQLQDLFAFEPQAYPYKEVDKKLLSNFPKLSQFSYYELTTYMENVLLRDTDFMSMASSLEVRVPFLDHELVEYVMNVSDKFKYPAYPKKLLIESVGNILPQEIYNRKKMGFNFPWEHWLRKELREYSTQKIEKLASRPEFNTQNVLRIWQDFLDHKKGISFSRVWVLVSLEATLENYGI